MYDVYFGLSEPPFENNLDQRFFFLSENHKEVLAALLYFVKRRQGLCSCLRGRGNRQDHVDKFLSRQIARFGEDR